MKKGTKNLIMIAGTGIAIIGVVVTLHLFTMSHLFDIKKRLARIETRLDVSAPVPEAPETPTSAPDSTLASRAGSESVALSVLESE